MKTKLMQSNLLKDIQILFLSSLFVLKELTLELELNN